MDEVVLDGVTYMRAAAAAKRFKYTTDYVGQLCRAEKVDARLVGRSWFVNPDSLAEHKRAKKGSSGGHETQSDRAQHRQNERVATNPKKRTVEPVLVGKTARQVASARQPLRRKVAVEYSIDDGHLIPELNVYDQQSASIRVEQVGSTKLSVEGEKKQTKFKPAGLPEVALSGDIAVGELIDEAAVPTKARAKNELNNTDMSSKNNAISDTDPNHNQTGAAQKIRIKKVRPKMQPAVTQSSATATTQSVPNNRKVITIPKSPRRSTMQGVERSKKTVSKQVPEDHTVDLQSTQNQPTAATQIPTQVARSQQRSNDESDGLSILRFMLLLSFVIVCGLAVGYLLVVSSSEYSVTASAARL